MKRIIAIKFLRMSVRALDFVIFMIERCIDFITERLDILMHVAYRIEQFADWVEGLKSDLTKRTEETKQSKKIGKGKKWIPLMKTKWIR